MIDQKPLHLPVLNQWLYAFGSLAFTVLERMIILYAIFYFLPPKELGLPNLIPDRIYLGIFTVAGAAFLFGRIFDGLADPIVATLSDNSKSPLGRRKKFLLISAFPLALTTVLIFLPPYPGVESVMNGVWLGVMMCLFYMAFTAYVNPFLALMSELGHTNTLRINISTYMALFGLIGMVCITVLFPQLVKGLTDAGFETRTAYQLVVGCFSLFCLIILFIVTLSFNEKKHCLPSKPSGVGALESLKSTFAVKPFRIFLTGEVFLQFAMNVVTLGLMYYAVVIFKQEESFMTTLAAITIVIALLSFPLVNYVAKKVGKKRVILFGVLILAIATGILFPLSFNIEGASFYIALGLIGLSGIPLAILSIMINPTIADMARADSLRTGQKREAMFFGARAIPLKATIALAGVTFTHLLSSLGKDISNPLGVQVSILVVSVASILSFICFSRYPEKEVQGWLSQGEVNIVGDEKDLAPTGNTVEDMKS